MNIPMSSPDLNKADIAAVNQVLQTQYLSMGPRVEAFEWAMADYVGTRYAAAVNSGTSGLHLAAIAAGVGAVLKDGGASAGYLGY
jgi:perosamine synthetase